MYSSHSRFPGLGYSCRIIEFCCYRAFGAWENAAIPGRTQVPLGWRPYSSLTHQGIVKLRPIRDAVNTTFAVLGGWSQGILERSSHCLSGQGSISKRDRCPSLLRSRIRRRVAMLTARIMSIGRAQISRYCQAIDSDSPQGNIVPVEFF